MKAEVKLNNLNDYIGTLHISSSTCLQLDSTRETTLER